MGPFTNEWCRKPPHIKLTTHQRKPALFCATASGRSAYPSAVIRPSFVRRPKPPFGSPAGGTRGHQSVHSGAWRSSFSGGPTVRILDLGLGRAANLMCEVCESRQSRISNLGWYPSGKRRSYQRSKVPKHPKKCKVKAAETQIKN